MEYGITLKLMWALVLFPIQPEYYTPRDYPSYVYRAYDTLEACEDARKVLEGGYPIAGEIKGTFYCVYEETWVQR